VSENGGGCRRIPEDSGVTLALAASLPPNPGMRLERALLGLRFGHCLLGMHPDCNGQVRQLRVFGASPLLRGISVRCCVCGKSAGAVPGT